MSEFGSDPGIHIAPWEKTFGKVLTPFEDFIHQETSGSILLILCTVVALALANSPLAHDYEALLHTHIVVSIGTVDSGSHFPSLDKRWIDGVVLFCGGAGNKT